MRVLLLGLLLGLSLPLTALAGLSPIGVHNGNFVDPDGRVRMFRGINSVIKHFPWWGLYSLTPVT